MTVTLPVLMANECDEKLSSECNGTESAVCS